MLETRHFSFLRDFIATETGVALRADQLDFSVKRLKSLCRSEDIHDVSSLLEAAEASPDSPLRAKIIEVLLENETIFFKGFDDLKYLRDVVVPELESSESGQTRTLRIWCAACGAGQDAYSMSIFIKDGLPNLATWDVNILATDISQSAIERANKGAFNQLEVSRGLPAKLLIKHFSRNGMYWNAHEYLKDQLTFKRHNLMDSWEGLGMFDVIFLRDLVTYFPDSTLKDLAKKVHEHLKPTGYLFLGTNEELEGFAQVVDATVPCFRRIQDTHLRVGETTPQPSQTINVLDSHIDTIQKALNEIDGESFDSSQNETDQ